MASSIIGDANCALSTAAYRAWRGVRPVSGYGRELIAWDYEDARMQNCWDAAVAWAASKLTRETKTGHLPRL